MYEIKTQLRVQFNAITDMSRHIRTIVSPYTKVSSNIKFLNVGRPEERTQINFVDEDLIISLDWQNLLVANLGKTTDLNKPEERYLHFFELLQKVKSLDTYNDLMLTKLETWDLLENQYSDYEMFVDSFLKTDETLSGFRKKDIALTLEGFTNDENLNFNVTFGPFNKDLDVKRHDLSLFNSSVFELDTSPKEGCLVHTNIVSKKGDFDRELLKSMLKAKNKIINNLSHE